MTSSWSLVFNYFQQIQVHLLFSPKFHTWIMILLSCISIGFQIYIFFLEIPRPDPCMHSLFLSASVIPTCIPNQPVYAFVKKTFCLYIALLEILSFISSDVHHRQDPVRHRRISGKTVGLWVWFSGRQKRFFSPKLAPAPT